MRCVVAASMLLFAFAGETLVSAGEQGRGLGRALNQAGKSMSSPGLNRAGPGLSRAGSGLNRANGLQRAPGLARAPLGKVPGGKKNVEGALVDGSTDQATRHQRQLEIEVRNRDHRLAQAQKLRVLAETNGNAELAANADRMEAAAQQHYEQRVDQLGRFGVNELSLNPAVDQELTGTLSSPPESEINVATPSPPTPAETPRAAARSSWKPKWWGTR